MVNLALYIFVLICFSHKQPSLKRAVLLNLFKRADINVLKSIQEQLVKKLGITKISLLYFNSLIAFFLSIKIMQTSGWNPLSGTKTQNLFMYSMK